MSQATATRDPDLDCELHCTSQKHQILNPLSEARGWTWVLMDTSQVLNLLSYNRNSLSSYILLLRMMLEFPLWCNGLAVSLQHQDTGLIPSPAQWVKRLQLQHRLQPWLISERWPGNFICQRVAKKKKNSVGYCLEIVYFFNVFLSQKKNMVREKT